jgi:branched-chain amino acid transport system permease protein
MSARGWLLVVIAAGVAIAAAAVGLPSYYLNVLIQACILALFAMSLDLLVGYAGLPSLGHAVFFGTAAYAAAILAVRVQVPFWGTVALGLAATLLLALVFGALALQTRGVYFLMITLALGQVGWGIAARWRSVTGGEDGLPGVPVAQLLPGLTLGTPQATFVVAAALVVLQAAGLRLLMASPFGYTIRGIHASESRMAALGYHVWAWKYLLYVIAALGAGLAGLVAAYHYRFVSPGDLHLLLSAEGLLMVILGGAATILGPVAGAFLVVLVQNLVSTATERWVAILGIIYVGVIMFLPGGIAGGVEQLWRRTRRARRGR